MSELSRHRNTENNYSFFHDIHDILYTIACMRARERVVHIAVCKMHFFLFILVILVFTNGCNWVPYMSGHIKINKEKEFCRNGCCYFQRMQNAEQYLFHLTKIQNA